MCEGFPERRVELDTYLAIIADLALSYGGGLFYRYHQGFSAKAALRIQRFIQRLDRSVLELVGRTFTGLRPLCCSVCGSFTPSTGLCPHTVGAKWAWCCGAAPFQMPGVWVRSCVYVFQ